MNEPESVRLEWAALITTPSGEVIHEPSHSRAGASLEVYALNRSIPGSAKLTYREIVAGEWTDATTGDEFGVRIEWLDGHHEIHPGRDRVDAERELGQSNRRDGQTARLVSRKVTHGQWWLSADATASA